MIFKVILLLCFLASVYGEDLLEKPLGPLPPIGISLDAPIQIDEQNLNAQHRYTSDTPKKLEELIQNKEFPTKALLLALAAAGIYLAIKYRPTAQEEEELPPMTPDERITKATELLSNADDVLTNNEALLYFNLLDPLATGRKDLLEYFEYAEQVKFAAFPAKKTEMALLLGLFKGKDGTSAAPTKLQ